MNIKYLYRIRIFFINKRKKYPLNPKHILNKLKKSQYWERTTTQEYQLEKINELIKSSFINVNYYKDSDFSYSNLNDFSNLFPKITKAKVAKNYDDLINNQVLHRIKKSTSGSTGIPMIVEISAKAMVYRVASLWRFYSWWGIDLYDKYVLIKGFKIKKENKFSIIKQINSLFQNKLNVNVFNLNDDTILDYYNKIEKFRPKYIRGYKSGALMLANLMEKHNLRFKRCKLDVIFVTGETLFENEREFMEKILNTKVANEYGSAECGLYAYECPSGSMHLDEESKYISTDKEGKGLVTELHNDGMPLINYSNNDKFIISEDYCDCGRTSRLIEHIEGRDEDFIMAPDGSRRHVALFHYFIEELVDLGYTRAFKEFKIVQNKNKFVFDLVKGDNFNSYVLDYIKKRMLEEIGNDIHIDFNFVPKVQRDKSGKLKFFTRVKE